MAIVKKKEADKLPEYLAEQARGALFLQVASTYFEDKFKDVKNAFFGIIANCNDITLEVGKSFRFSDGLFRWQSRANHKINSELVANAVAKGTLTTETLLACVSKWNVETLKAIVPGAVEEADPTEYGVMQASPEFKARVIARLEEDSAVVLAATEEALPIIQGKLEAR